MAELPEREEVERLLGSFSRALHPRELASRLELEPEDYGELIALLDRIEQEGGLSVLPGGRVKLKERRTSQRPSRGRGGASQHPSHPADARKGGSKTPQKGERTWVGTLSAHAKGFAFVSGANSREDDVFIPPDALYEALHGDTVLVRVTGQSKKGLEGVVERVEKRRDPRVAGIVRKKAAASWLEPDDSRLRGPITLTGDLSAARDGDSAVVTITRFPQFSEELPEAELVEVLGPAGDPQTEVRKILLRESVAEEHSAECLRNAEQMATRLGAIRLGTRRDLRQVPLPTIDPEDARDHDDAVWVERRRGGYRVYVAIADVSEYVRPESPLDEEARARGCTIYLPDRAIPMLPRALAGDLCSLLPERDRFCMCVIAELDKSGQTQSFEIVEGVMRSAAKLTYAGVARTLGFDPESPQSPQAETFRSDLEVLAEVSEKLRKNRMARGALDLDLPEARVVIDDATGAPIEVKKRATRPGLKRAYSLIEELMLLANELVARFLDENKLPAIYRIHAKPDAEKLERLAKVVEKLDLDVDMESLLEPKGASRFLNLIQGHERKPVLETLLLRSLKQAVYDVDNVGHFGLASERYVHFTSPIRRYPDLRVHRQIKQVLRGKRIDTSDQAVDDLRQAAVESSKKERAAMEIEREVQNLYRALYMQNHVGEVFQGRVTGISGGGLYLAVEDPCVDVMVQFEALGQDQYELDEDELGVVGRRSKEHIMLGDELTVEIADVSIIRRTVYGRRLKEGQAAESTDDWKAPAYSMDDFAPEGTTPFSPHLGARKTFRSTTTTAQSRNRRGQSAQRNDPAPKSFKERAASSKKSSGRPERATRTGGTTRTSEAQQGRRGGATSAKKKASSRKKPERRR